MDMSGRHNFSKLSILIAAYNEEMTLQRCVERVLSAFLPDGLSREVVLVDDASTDSTPAIGAALASEHEQVRFFRQEKNQGKGAALNRAIREMSGDLAIFQDADLEYDPRDYARVLGS
jgi:glycosyltransferase involved in cell wall biosynthesis